MPTRTLLEGNKVEAAKWLPTGRRELIKVKALGLQRGQLRPTNSVSIRVSSAGGVDTIHIIAEKGIFYGMFLATPHDDVSHNGWQEPFETGTPPVPVNDGLGTAIAWLDGIQHPDTVYSLVGKPPKSLTDTTARRYPAQVTQFGTDGAKAGVNNWIGPKGEVLSWKGTQNMIPKGIIPTVNQITTTTYDAEVFVGQEIFHSISSLFYRIVQRQTGASPLESGYIITPLFSSEVFYNGAVLANAPTQYVTGASFRKDATGRKWLQMIYGTYNTTSGIWKENFWTAPMSDLTDVTTIAMFTYATTAVNLAGNMCKWSFNQSGTEAHVASRLWGTAVADDYTCKLEIVDGATDPDVATPPTIIPTQVEIRLNNSHTGLGPFAVESSHVDPVVQVSCAPAYANRIYSGSGSDTNSVSNANNYTILAMDYVGDKLVYAAANILRDKNRSFSFSNTVGTVDCAPGTAHQVAQYASFAESSAASDSHKIFFSQNPSATIEVFATTSTSNTSFGTTMASGSQSFTRGTEITGYLGYIDPRYQIAELVLDVFGPNSVSRSGATCTTSVDSGRSRVTSQHLYVGLNNSPETFWSSSNPIPGSTSTISCWTNPYSGDGFGYNYLYSNSSGIANLQPSLIQNLVVGGINALTRNDTLVLMVSFPKGYAAATYIAGDSWNVRGTREFYNVLSAYTIGASKLTIRGTVDMSIIEPLPDIEPRYIPICALAGLREEN